MRIIKTRPESDIKTLVTDVCLKRRSQRSTHVHSAEGIGVQGAATKASTPMGSPWSRLRCHPRGHIKQAAGNSQPSLCREPQHLSAWGRWRLRRGGHRSTCSPNVTEPEASGQLAEATGREEEDSADAMGTLPGQSPALKEQVTKSTGEIRPQ